MSISVVEKLIMEKYEPIAIIGVALRFPGSANTLLEFEQLLKNGVDGIKEIPKSRWDNSKYYSNEKDDKRKIKTHSGGYIDNFDLFDPNFFSISPKESQYIDPQQRIMLELAWESLESANINPTELIGTNGGVFIGVSTTDFIKEITLLHDDQINGYMGTGSSNSAIPGRISYFFGLHGPSMVIDTACSSSLVALHTACNALRNSEASFALCGGVNIIHNPSNHISFSSANMLATDGRCKTFDDSADGYGRSEGAAMLVLKRLSDAKKDNHRILAIVRGTAVMQDGQSSALMVPNGASQELVMNKAIENALLQPSDISYVEAHGTGTPLGDPIEIAAISNVFNAKKHLDEKLTVSTVKTNIGHTEGTAGLAGVIKVILQIKNKSFFQHLHFKNPSKHIDWTKVPIQIPRESQDWKTLKRCALVNSFGFAGTIASAVVEEYNEELSVTNENDHNGNFLQVLTISAKSKSSLKGLISQYKSLLANANLDLKQICYNSNYARAHFKYRLATNLLSRSDLDQYLSQHYEKISNETHAFETQKECAFIYAGQGAQYSGMGGDLYESSVVFRRHIDICDHLFSKHINRSIKDVMFLDSDGSIDETQFTQPALFAMEYALTMMWMSFGLTPRILIGHSIGEIVAATVSGLFNLEDAIQLVAARSKWMGSVNTLGSMIAINLSAEEVSPYIAKWLDLSIAAINTKNQTVVSGDAEQIHSLEQALAHDSIVYKRLNVSHAFHSKLMGEILVYFKKEISHIKFNLPAIPFVSNITGKIASPSEVMNVDYWVNHIISPVQFYAGMQAVYAFGVRVFVDVSPTSGAAKMARNCLSNYKNSHFLRSIDRAVKNTETISDVVSKLYCLGFDLNWSSIVNRNSVRPVDLPIYQFDRKKYWLEPSLRVLPYTKNQHVLLGNMVDSDNNQWLFQSDVSPQNPGYLADHVIKGEIVFPAVGFLEIIVALQDSVFGTHTLFIEDLKISEPLFLYNTHSVKLMTSLRKKTSDGYEFLIYSEHERGNKRHASGKLKYSDTGSLDLFSSDSMPDFGAEPDTLISGEELYTILHNKGLELGQSFINVLKVRIYSEMHASADIREYNATYGEYLNPAIADSVLHAIEPIVSSFDNATTYLPVGIERFIFLKRPKGHLISKVSVKKMGGESQFDYLANLSLEDSYGTVFLAKNLQIKAISQLGKSENSYLNALYDTRWYPLKSVHVDKNIPDSVVIFGDHNSNKLHFVHSISSLDQYLQNTPACAHVVFAWSSASNHSMADAEEILKNNYTNILGIIRLMNEKYSNRLISLCFITNHAQILPMDDIRQISDTNLIQSTLWGFCNVLNQEFPKLRPRIIDIDCLSDSSSYDKIIHEISATDTELETQIAYRSNLRFVKRLVNIDLEDNNFEFIISEYGDFANIKKNYIPTKKPKIDEVFIEVCAVGLNFKDVLNASGLLKHYYEIPLGFECSGVVLDAGSGSGFNVGDEVIVSYSGCMKRYLTVNSKYVVMKPKNITMYQAAGLPTAYITSYHSLHNLAKIKSSDSILIHSAAGGVGHAAIELAKRVNAKLYVTSHESKWGYLEKYGIENPMSSRDSEFADRVMELTLQGGVDIVLNSLSADLIPAGINTLSKNGKFINLTKINNIDESDALKLRSDISYYNFDLGLMDDSQINTKEILTEITELIELEEIKPIPISLYSTDAIGSAFQELASGQSKGKIVISFMEEDGYQRRNTNIEIKPKCTYIVTGGYGAIGIETAQWLAASGAEKIALLGRTPPSNDTMTSLCKRIPQEKLIFLTGDVSNEAQMRELILSLDKSSHPIDGIIHAAGELADHSLASIQYDAFEKVFRSKVFGTYVLHKVSSEIKNLGFFISYSSIASFSGITGQSNYSAANSYIDTLMSYREKLGKRSLAVNWGPWSDIGMAAKLNLSVVKYIEEKGIFSIKPAVAMNTLAKYLNHSSAHLVIGSFDWSRYYQKLPFKSAFYHKIIINEDENKSESLKHVHILELSDEEKHSYISNYIRAILKEIMLFSDMEDIDPYSKFSELGVDSLTSVEFQVSIEKLFNIKLVTSFLHIYPSIPDLAKHITDQIVEINFETRNCIDEHTSKQLELS